MCVTVFVGDGFGAIILNFCLGTGYATKFDLFFCFPHSTSNMFLFS